MNVCMISLGCAKNLVDSERMLYLLKEHGCYLTQEPEDADIVVINTCGFIEAAKEEAIETILEMVQLKEAGVLKGIVVTGCLAERYRQEVVEQLPEVDAVIGIGDQTVLCEVIDRVAAGERVAQFAPKSQMPLTGGRELATLPFLAYLKVAEGCSNGCTYCAIPAIRGKFRSVPMEDVLAEAQSLADRGVKELVVIAQDTTRYGEDLYGVSKLPELLTKLCAIDGFRWIRVLYCYPERITDELIDVIAREEKIVKYMDIPIQHCNTEILQKMRREGSKEELCTLFAKLRERIPGITLRTTLMTGFPGETDAQFEELAEFVQEMRFDRMGCFAYSEEENTIAARMADQVDVDVRRHRAELLMDSQAVISAEKNAARVGTVAEAVVEGRDCEIGMWVARTAADAPDVDGRVYIQAPKETIFAVGQFVTLRIIDTMDYDLVGEVMAN